MSAWLNFYINSNTPKDEKRLVVSYSRLTKIYELFQDYTDVPYAYDAAYIEGKSKEIHYIRVTMDMLSRIVSNINEEIEDLRVKIKISQDIVPLTGNVSEIISQIEQCYKDIRELEKLKQDVAKFELFFEPYSVVKLYANFN